MPTSTTLADSMPARHKILVSIQEFESLKRDFERRAEALSTGICAARSALANDDLVEAESILDLLRRCYPR